MRSDSSRLRYLHQKQHQEQARWLLLAALAQEYPQHVELLLAAREAFERAMGPRDGDLQMGRVLQMFKLKTGFTPRLEDEPSLPGWRLGPPSPLSLAVVQWAKVNGLMVQMGYTRELIGNLLGPIIPIFRPAFWVGEFALKLLEAQVRDAQSVEQACLQHSVPYRLSFTFEHETEEQRVSYPQPPELGAFVPRFQSKEDFLAEAARKLGAYTDEMLAWIERKGETAEKPRRAADRHYRWLAWHLCEGLGTEEIVLREAERLGEAGEVLDDSTVRKALFGSNGLKQLTGFVKEID